MEQGKIDRINELARKAKVEELTDDEKKEQQDLRKEYVAAFKASLRGTLENVRIVDEDGNKINPKKKN